MWRLSALDTRQPEERRPDRSVRELRRTKRLQLHTRNTLFHLHVHLRRPFACLDFLLEFLHFQSDSANSRQIDFVA
jgi:hypothetical protein